MDQFVVGASLHSPPVFFSPVRSLSLHRHSSSVGIERGANQRRIIWALAAASSSRNFPSVSFPVRFFSRPPSFPADVLAIALFVSSVLAAVAFSLKIGRKNHISDRKIVPYQVRGRRSKPNDDTDYGEEEFGVARDARWRKTENMIVSSLIDSMDASGRSFQGSGDRDLSKESSFSQKVSQGKIDEDKLEKTSVEKVEIVNVIQLFDEVNEGRKSDGSKAFFSDVQLTGSLNTVENEVTDDQIEDDMETSRGVTPFLYEESGLFSTITRSDDNTNVVANEYGFVVEEEMGSRIVSGSTDGSSVSGYTDLGNLQMIVNDDVTEIDGHEAGLEQMTENYVESTNLHHIEQELSCEDTKLNSEVLVSQTNDTFVKEKSELSATISGTKYVLGDSECEEDHSSDSWTTLQDLSLQHDTSVVGSSFGHSNQQMEDITAEEELSDEVALQRAMPAIAVGVGALGVLSTGGHGALEVVGFIALSSFIAYDLLWASSRENWWRNISKVTDREQLESFLRSRNII